MMANFLQSCRYVRLPQRMTKRLSKWSKPVTNVANDYLAVLRETFDYMRDHPIRGVGLLTFFGGGALLWNKNPSFAHYMDSVTSYSLELSMCSESTRNPAAQRYVTRIGYLESNLLLRYYNFGIFSLIMKQDYHSCRNFGVTSKHLKTRWWEVSNKVVDIGVLNTWIKLEEYMVDFDVNYDNLKNLN